MATTFEKLTALFRGLEVGQVIVESLTPRSVKGVFSPGPDFAEFQPLFDEARSWFERIIPSDGQTDVQAMHRWGDVSFDLSGDIKFAELTASVEYFYIYTENQIEAKLIDSRGRWTRDGTWLWEGRGQESSPDSGP